MEPEKEEGRFGGGGIFSFSYMDDSKIPAAFKKDKKKKKTNTAEAEISQETRSSFSNTHGGHANGCFHAKICKKARMHIHRKRRKKSKTRVGLSQEK